MAQESTKKRKRSGQINSVQVMFAAILAVGLLLGINFSARIAAGQPLQQTYLQVQREVTVLESEQADLIALRDYVRGDTYVEQWARDEGKMVRPGMILIVPVPSGVTFEPTPIPQPSIPIQTGAPEQEPWQLWWHLFFDSVPPEFD